MLEKSSCEAQIRISSISESATSSAQWFRLWMLHLLKRKDPAIVALSVMRFEPNNELWIAAYFDHESQNWGGNSPFPNLRSNAQNNIRITHQCFIQDQMIYLLTTKVLECNDYDLARELHVSGERQHRREKELLSSYQRSVNICEQHTSCACPRCW
jgi:hypothetical protein